MYKKILVPVDDSQTSMRALREAVALAKALGAELRLLHLVNDFPYAWNAEMPGDLNVVKQYCHQAGEQILREARQIVREAGMTAEADLLDYDGTHPSERISERIIEAAQKCRADLIAMGTHGRHGFEHLMLGSVAEGVVRSADIPVLLLRS